MDGGGFEPPKQFAADLQSVPFGHSGIHPKRVRLNNLTRAEYITFFEIAQVFFLINYTSHAKIIPTERRSNANNGRIISGDRL